MFFSYLVGNVIIPSDFLIFFKGVKPPTRSDVKIFTEKMGNMMDSGIRLGYDGDSMILFDIVWAYMI